jgi:hypothetical protein
VFDGPAGGFGAVVDVELGVDVLDVAFDGAGAEGKLSADLVVAAATREQAEDLLFALREDWSCGGSVGLVGELRADVFVPGFAEVAVGDAGATLDQDAVRDESGY